LDKIGDSGVKRFTDDFEILSVHDLLQHLASPGEKSKQG